MSLALQSVESVGVRVNQWRTGLNLCLGASVEAIKTELSGSLAHERGVKIR